MSLSREKGHQASELTWVDPGATRLALKFNEIAVCSFEAKIQSVWQTAPSFRERQRVECNVAMTPSSASSGHEERRISSDLRIVSEADETQLGNTPAQLQLVQTCRTPTPLPNSSVTSLGMQPDFNEASRFVTQISAPEGSRTRQVRRCLTNQCA